MIRRRHNALRTALMAVVMVTCASGGALAQDFMGRPLIKPGEEVFTLYLGGIVNHFDTQLRLDGQTQRGTDINFENSGLKDSLSSFDAAGVWRFLPRHRIDVEYFSTRRSGTRTYDRSITIGDNAYPLGATVSASAEDRFLIADYRYSFVKSDRLELAGVLGFYGGNFKFRLDAAATGGANAAASVDTSTTVPLPLIGASADWYVNPRWKIAGNVQGMKASIGDVDGRVLVASAATEYMFTRNVGAGLRYMYTDVDVDVSKTNFNGNVTWRMNSVALYAKLMF